MGEGRRQLAELRGVFSADSSSGAGRLRGAVLGAMVLLAGVTAWGQANLPIYTDHLVNGFQDWSWLGRNLANTSPPVHSGSDSISASGTVYEALSFEHPDFNATLYSSLSFWVNGGVSTGGQMLQVYAQYGSTNGPSYALSPLPTNAWQQYVIPLSALGVANASNLNRLNLQLMPGPTNTFYVDDIQLVAKPGPALVHLNVNAAQIVRSADARWFSVNTALWDNNYDTPTTISLLQEMGTHGLRGPGGSLSDEYNWVTDENIGGNYQWPTSFASFLHVATNIGAQTIITVNYGTGSSNMAAAWVAYANGAATNTRSLGVDPFGTNWQTVGYWAALRGAARLGTDDGKNFLRISRSAPLAFKYWEIGNECYGGWETDSNAVAHDPYTYATRANGYLQMMRAVDPTIKLGVVVAPGEDSYINNTNHAVTNPRTGLKHYGWTPVLLATLKGLGAMPDYAIHHVYPEYTGQESDPLLLQTSISWPSDAADLRQQISDYIGAGGTNIELLCTENNSNSGNQGKQSTSLVNGLYYADSLGHLMQTEFNSLVWWDLRNGSDTSGSFDPTLYGWRTYGDLGMINGLNTLHPTFYAAKLAQYLAQAGDSIVSATSDYLLLSGYAARHADGAVSLLVLNKDTTTNFTGQIALSGFAPNSVATIRSYGMPQDNAAQSGIGSQDIAQTNFAGVSASFNYVFAPLSMTLFTFAPAAPRLAVLPPAPQPSGQIVLQLQGQAGVRYVLETSTNLSAGVWTAVSTNTLAASTLNFTNSTAGVGKEFWRAVWQP